MQAVYGKAAALPHRHIVNVAESESDMPQLSFPGKLDEELPCQVCQTGLGGLQHKHSHLESSKGLVTQLSQACTEKAGAELHSLCMPEAAA